MWLPLLICVVCKYIGCLICVVDCGHSLVVGYLQIYNFTLSHDVPQMAIILLVHMAEMWDSPLFVK